MKLKFYFFTFITICYRVLYAQNNQLEIDYLKIEDGLPHSTVNDIIQDSLGYIWMATDDGVAYYDNYTIKVYRQNTKDVKGIVSNQSLKLHIDPQNRLWVGTKQSLELYNEKTGTFEHFYLLHMPKGERVPVVEIFQENKNLLLLGTDGGGLRYFNTLNNSSGFYLPDNIQKEIGKRVSSILRDKYGRYWIGTFDKGVFLYDQRSLSIEGPLDLYNFLENTEIRKLTLLNPQELLVGTYGKGTVKIDIDSLAVSPFLPNNKALNSAKRIFQITQSDNQLFIGSDGEGVIVVDLNTFDTKCYKNCENNSESISNNVVRSICIDHEKGLWLGHYQGGISHVSTNNKFQNIKYIANCKNSLSHTNVTSILADDQNNIWLGTDGGGLNIIKNKEIYNCINDKLSSIYSGPNPQKILCLFEDSENNIWIGTYLEGVFIFNSKTKQLRALDKIYPNIQLSNSDIRCIMQDHTGKIWIGTNGGGVNIINPETKEHTVLKRNDDLPAQSLSLDWVRFIQEDSCGCIWIGTTYGLNVYDPDAGKFQQFFYDEKDSTSISSSFTYSYVEDINHQIWIGTAHGLNKYNRNDGTFKFYTEADGLPGCIINGIIDTKDGNLWISTNNGLSKFNIRENRFCNYSCTDGIASNSFINSSFCNQNNEFLYFGSIAGVTYFNPKEITEVDYDIPVLLTDFKIYNQSIHASELYDGREVLKDNIAKISSVEIIKRDQSITVDFTALSYSYKDKIEYEYRLLGISDKWLNAKKEHSITYTRLEPGTYNLQIRVGNIGENQPVRNLEIIVLPPFYETWWFTVFVFVVVCMLVVFIRLKLISIKRKNDVVKEHYEIEKLEVKEECHFVNQPIDETKMQFQQDEMNYKNSQLISTTILLTHKNQKMNQVKNKISTFTKSIDDKDLKKDLVEIVETIGSEFEVEKDWNKFEEHFNNVHNDFLKRLKENYPQLSPTYLRLCSLLKLDLSTKEIASLMNISQRGVEKARSRLRKKMELSPDENLNQYIAGV